MVRKFTVKINDFQNFFLYNHVWWIYIFIDCPYLSNAIKDEMNNILQKVRQTLNKEIASCIAKKEVIKFLQNTVYRYKFIN